MIAYILTDPQRTFGAVVTVVSICLLFVYYLMPPTVRALDRAAARKIAPLLDEDE